MYEKTYVQCGSDEPLSSYGTGKRSNHPPLVSSPVLSLWSRDLLSPNGPSTRCFSASLLLLSMSSVGTFVEPASVERRVSGVFPRIIGAAKSESCLSKPLDGVEWVTPVPSQSNLRSIACRYENGLWDDGLRGTGRLILGKRFRV